MVTYASALGTQQPDGELHRLLRRQIDRHVGGVAALPAELRSLLGAIDDAYRQSDEDRKMLERSLELSSRELLQANTELRTLFQALPDFFFRIDAEGHILDYKGGQQEDFYLTPSQLIGKRLQDIPNQAVSATLGAALRQVVQDRAMVTVEYALHVDGVTRHYEARLLPLPLEGQYIAIVRNITERVKTTQDLAEKTRANAELEQFAYIASHDLQEPLRTVQSYLQLLQRRYQDRLDGDANEFIRFAVDGSTRMRQLINDLLSYARVTSRRKRGEPTDLGAVVDEVRSSLATAIRETEALLRHDGLPVVNADRSQLVQLFQNLISNALKFRSARPPVVRIAAQDTADGWHFTVADNGIGLSPQYAERIFVIFQRLHGRDEYPGTGMGLAICKKIVEGHGGRIWVESRVGEGATFHFTLPCSTTIAAGDSDDAPTKRHHAG